MQEARHLQLDIITAPGTLLHDLVRTGSMLPIESMDSLVLAETGRYLIKTPLSERARHVPESQQQEVDASHAALMERLAVLVPCMQQQASR